MKTTISIIAGIIFGFAGTAFAYECPDWMTDDNCERAKEEAAGKSAAAESSTLLAGTFSHIDTWTEEREDGVYYCKVQIDTDGNRMGEPSCYLTTTARIYCDANGNCTSPGQGKSASSVGDTQMAMGETITITEQRPDGLYVCTHKMGTASPYDSCEKVEEASAGGNTMLAEGGCFQNDDGSYTCYGEDGSIIQAGAASLPPTMMASGEVIHCDAGLCYTCDSSGSCRDIDSGSASAKTNTMMASGEVIHCDAGLCYTCDSSGSCRDIDSGSASAEPKTMMASGEVIHCDAGLCYTCDSSGSCRDIDSGSASAEPKTMMASGEVIHCDAGLCYTCDSSGSCRDIDSGSASAKQQTMHASLRMGDPNPDSLCGGTDPWSCFNGTDTSPVLRDVSIFAAMYGDDK